MPTQIQPITSSQISVNWQEQYTSDALNRKAAVTQPPGIYRGFNLKADGSFALSVDVLPEPGGNDQAASFTTSTGYALALKIPGSAGFRMDLSAFAGQTVVIALWATYADTVATTAEIRAYALSPTDEWSSSADRPYAVVLGTVNVPASGLIPAANVSTRFRTEAWENTPRCLITPKQYVVNGSFMFAKPGANSGQYACAYWTNTAGGGSVQWSVSDASIYRPSNYDTRVLVLPASGGVRAGAFTQHMNRRVRGGEQLRIRVRMQVRDVPASGSILFRVSYGDLTMGTQYGTTDVTLVDSSSQIDGDWRIFEANVTVPTAVVLATNCFIQYVSIIANNVIGSNISNPTVLIDYVQIWNDARNADDVIGIESEGLLGEVHAANLFLHQDGGGSLSDVLARLYTDVTTDSQEPRLSGLRSDDDSVGLSDVNRPLMLDWPGRVAAGKRLAPASRLRARYEAPSVLPVTGQVDLTLLFTSQNGTGKATRLFADSNGNLVITVNAYAALGTPLTWQADDASLASTKVVFGNGNVSASFFRAGAGAGTTWLDTAWTSSPWSAKDDTGTASPSSGEINAQIRHFLQTKFGESMIGTAANALLARQLIPRAGSDVCRRTLIWHSKANSGAIYGDVRVYVTASNANGVYASGEGLEITNNCYWDEAAALWRHDGYGGTNATRIFFGSTNVQFCQHSGASSWAENDWPGYAVNYLNSGSAPWGLKDGHVSFEGTTYASTPECANPDKATVPYGNTLYAKNLIKAWGRFRTTGSGSPGGWSMVDGFNLGGYVAFLGTVYAPNIPVYGSYDVTTQVKYMTIGFGTPMKDTNYIVLGGGLAYQYNMGTSPINPGNGFTVHPTTQDPHYFDAVFLNGGGSYDPSAVSLDIWFAVLGLQ